MKRALLPIVRLWCIAYYRWAIAEIHPLHPDVPYIVHRLHYWRNAV